jgi:DNA mismatch repair protein MutL
MPTKIKLLPDNVINQIAAGEVVDRPASIVKELLENSIDAQSDKIKIEIKNGGKKLIKIVDNGEGMSRDDLFLAFERHATSKIYSFIDLNNVKTLGFRGEALPSIASISRIKAQAKSKNCEIGTEVILEAGVIKKISDTVMNRGFSIEVKNIFYNVPARLKFLKSDTTEYFYIDNVIKRFLLAYPLIDFTVSHNSRTKHYPKCKKLTDRISQIYSENILKSLQHFTIEDNDFSINGYVTLPNITS